MAYLLFPISAGLLMLYCSNSEEPNGRWVAAVIGILWSLASLFFLFISWVALGLQCDDNCGTADYHGWPADAWQWTAHLIIAFVGASAVLAATGLALSRWKRGTFFAVSLAAVAWSAWITMSVVGRG